MSLPQLTQARAPLTREVEVMNEHGARETISIPAERDLTVYVDKRELVTLMTLGARPEWLVLGYLLNQRLIGSVDEIESITVDWDVNAASVKTRHGIDRIEERTSKRVVTTGCGQGSVFGNLMDEIDNIRLPDEAGLKQSQLYAIVNAIRLKESTYKSAGSVHACALFYGEELQLFVEDVGRHNAVDTIAGWMSLQSAAPHRREDLLHHGPSHQRDGDQVGPDGRGGGGLAQRHHPDGAGRGPARGSVRHRPRDQQAFPLLRQPAAPGARRGAARRARGPRARRQPVLTRCCPRVRA
jgi:formate dehydrogenase accessory protein FdhD